MSAPLIQTRKLGLRFGAKVILHDVDFSINAGEIVTIVGPNGSGKSSFVKCLIGAIAPSEGQIEKAPGLKIGYVPQKLQLDTAFPMTVRRFLRLQQRSGGKGIDEINHLVEIETLLPLQLSTLSGGQLQRVLLAHALISKPNLLILDEAAQGLDQPAVAGFYHLIEEVRRSMGCAILMVSHDLHVVMSASDRVVCLNGHICCQGTPLIVSEAPEYRQLFGAGTEGTLALYRHQHDHRHETGEGDDHAH